MKSWGRRPRGADGDRAKDRAKVDQLRDAVPDGPEANDLTIGAQPNAELLEAGKLAQEREHHVRAMESQEIARLQQQNALRLRFFTFASALAVGVLVFGCALIGYYAWSVDGKVDPGVLKFWISSTIVEVLGIIYIIARYLFPPPAPTE
jgi:hypothetical protein